MFLVAGGTAFALEAVFGVFGSVQPPNSLPCCKYPGVNARSAEGQSPYFLKIHAPLGAFRLWLFGCAKKAKFRARGLDIY